MLIFSSCDQVEPEPHAQDIDRMVLGKSLRNSDIVQKEPTLSQPIKDE